MGTFSKGILGGFSGTVGTVIGGNWKGIDYMRSKPVKSKKQPSPLQEDQRRKFAMISLFCEVMTAYFEVTYRSFADKMSAVNAAFSYTSKNAIGGVSPDFTILYAKALVSRGKLPNGGAPAAAVTAGNNITFTWTDNSGAGGATVKDKAMPLVYCPALNQCIFSDGAAGRSAGTVALNVALFTGQKVEVWLAFATTDNEDASMSAYLGEMTL